MRYTTMTLGAGLVLGPVGFLAVRLAAVGTGLALSALSGPFASLLGIDAGGIRHPD